jgi:CheY-like chemotaxis protein
MQETVPGDPLKALKLRVLVVDDDIRVRRALRSLIECAPDLIVVGEARSTASAKRLDLELLPDVVVLDLLLPQALDGMGVLRELRGRGRPVVAITGLGVKTPAGQTVDDMWETLVAARPAAGTITLYDASDHSVGFACEVRDFDAVPYVGPKEVRRTDRTALLGLAAATDAVADACATSLGTPKMSSEVEESCRASPFRRCTIRSPDPSSS